jgi:dGTPase
VGVPQRSDRRNNPPSSQFADHRTPFEIDRDRVLYVDAFRRLGGVTQVAGPNENHQFHNRLSHSLKVAQIAERLAQRLLKEKKDAAEKPDANAATIAAHAALVGELDVSVAVTAALAHDLGHPPFGHVAEEELDHLVKAEGNKEGYEGNAQSFRILTKLSVHQHEYDGLNLTRATLNAVLKYPWARDLINTKSKKHRKFGYYSSEQEDFKFARDGFKPDPAETSGRGLEAQLMDYADEVTYSIHDFEDFYRAGLIPVAALQRDEREFGRFLDRWAQRLKARGQVDPRKSLEQKRLFYLDVLYPLPEHFSNDLTAQIELRKITSINIGEAVTQPQIKGSRLLLNPDIEEKHRFLQELIWQYVILNPRLASQQIGQRRVIRTLFESYKNALDGKREDLVPPAFQNTLSGIPNRKGKARKSSIARVSADIVSSLNDQQALTIYQRFLGVAPGAVTDLLM